MRLCLFRSSCVGDFLANVLGDRHACTCSFSLFAYIWLYFVLGVATPHCVTLAEALATFAFFPLLVLLAYKVRAPDPSDLRCISTSEEADRPTK